MLVYIVSFCGFSMGRYRCLQFGKTYFVDMFGMDSFHESVWKGIISQTREEGSYFTKAFGRGLFQNKFPKTYLSAFKQTVVPTFSKIWFWYKALPNAFPKQVPSERVYEIIRAYVDGVTPTSSDAALAAAVVPTPRECTKAAARGQSGQSARRNRRGTLPASNQLWDRSCQQIHLWQDQIAELSSILPCTVCTLGAGSGTATGTLGPGSRRLQVYLDLLLTSPLYLCQAASTLRPITDS